MKRLARRVLGGLLVLMLGGWLLLNLLDINQLRQPVLSWLNDNTELDIDIGRLEFNPLSPYRLLAEDVRLGDWFSARQVYLELERLAPLSGHTQVAIVDVIDGRLRLTDARLPALPDSLASISVAELNTRNLSLSGADWEAAGINLQLRQWQPRHQGQWQWWSEASLSGQVRQLSHPQLALSRMELTGRLSQGRLELNELRGRLAGGLFSGAISLDATRRELHLEQPRLSQVRLQLDAAPVLPEGWRVRVSRARLDDVSLTTPWLTTNGLRGELKDLEWNGTELPDGRGDWQAEEATLGWLRLDRHRLHWLGNGERQDVTLNGLAWEGSLEAGLSWYPAQGRLDIDELQLLGNKLVWQPDMHWPVPDVRIHKLNLSRTELLSLDEQLPLSLFDGDLFITDLAWSAGLWRPLSEQARLEGSAGELAWDSLIARNAGVSARLTDSRLLLDELRGEWLDGSLQLRGEMGLYPPHQTQLELTGNNWQLRHLSNWLRAGQGFTGELDVSLRLSGEPQDTGSWQGSLRLDGRELFVEQLGLDPWLRNRLGEDYAEPKRVDTALAALDMQQNDGFLYRLDLHGPVTDGRWQLDGSALQSVRHLLALRGGLSAGGRLDLDLGAINDAGCRELAIGLSGDWQAPAIRLHQPTLDEPCEPWYRGPLPYPAAGLPGRLTEAVRALQQP